MSHVFMNAHLFDQNEKKIVSDKNLSQTAAPRARSAFVINSQSAGKRGTRFDTPAI